MKNLQPTAIDREREIDARPVQYRPAELAELWLADAYELVERGWCGRGGAEDESGRLVDPVTPTAVRWSPSGALLAVWRRSGVDDEVGLRALQLANLAFAAAVNDVPTAWNDAPGRRRHEVPEALLAAVSLVRDPVLFGGAVPSRDGDRLGERGSVGWPGFGEAA